MFSLTADKIKTSLKEHSQSGFTILEILVVIVVLVLLFTALVIMLNPSETLKKGRDNKRLSDLSMLDRVIIEYKVDQGVFPDASNTLRSSNVLPAGGSALAKSNGGWISGNMLNYTSKLPLDPLNDDTYHYLYIHNTDTYELNSKFEYDFTASQNDGGNDSTVYELGDNLTLISP